MSQPKTIHPSLRMAPYDLYNLYISLRNHFVVKDYNHFLYCGKTKISVDAFLQNQNNGSFKKLVQYVHKKDMGDFLLANFAYARLTSNIPWISQITSDLSTSFENFDKYKKINQALEYHLKQDMKKILKSENKKEEFRTYLTVPDHGLPKLLSYTFAHKISLETLTVLNGLIQFIPKWEEKINEEYIWPQAHMRIIKYSPFVEWDRNKMKKIVSDVFSC